MWPRFAQYGKARSSETRRSPPAPSCVKSRGNHMAIIWQSQGAPHLHRRVLREVGQHEPDLPSHLKAIIWQSYGNHMAIIWQPCGNHEADLPSHLLQLLLERVHLHRAVVARDAHRHLCHVTGQSRHVTGQSRH
eukprot:5193577-Prymnesium_polylepis.1